MNPIIVIPAIKKNVAFPDDLVKKLAGISLIQRAIENVLGAFSSKQILIVTDSEEINLIAKRNNVISIYDKSIKLEPNIYISSLLSILKKEKKIEQDIIVYSPYAPLFLGNHLLDAYHFYKAKKAKILLPVFNFKIRLFSDEKRKLGGFLNEDQGKLINLESGIFTIISNELLNDDSDLNIEPTAYPLNNKVLEIKNYEDWWICEKLLSRKCIVFRVIGYKEVGMGHIFRSLSLAHEISAHEIYFVCDKKSELAANKLAGYDYRVGVYDEDEIEQAIIDLKPDLVVNDILNTEAKYIKNLRTNGIKVINFEDVGNGATETNLTINDLYDEPLFEAKNVSWGQQWFVVRDEFSHAKRHKNTGSIKRILLAFGGTDPSDLTQKILCVVLDYCKEKKIAVDIVTGDGYQYIAELEAYVDSLNQQEVTYTHATGVISHIMEGTEVAVCSNGRTVYELAYMKIPSIVISHHERESTHDFACEENGFIPLGVYSENKTNNEVLISLKRLVEEKDYFDKLFKQMPRFNYSRNKKKIIKKIESFLT